MTVPKPDHLGPDYAAQFQDRGVVAAYRHRPPYPAAVFDILLDLLPPAPRTVLDAGCGTGDLARRLVERVERVDAVDWSAGMIEMGRGLPGGNHLRLTWIHARIEEAPLRPPYGLITAGESLHWFDWAAVLPRFRAALAPAGCLAIIERLEQPAPWTAGLSAIIPRYSTNRAFRPYDLVAELAARGLFHKQGEQRTAPIRVTQSLEDYVESIHSRNGFSRDRMPPAAAAAFDAEVARLLRPWTQAGRVELQIAARIIWGQPE